LFGFIVQYGKIPEKGRKYLNRCTYKHNFIVNYVIVTNSYRSHLYALVKTQFPAPTHPQVSAINESVDCMFSINNFFISSSPVFDNLWSSMRGQFNTCDHLAKKKEIF
jgi:hypothetical protein